MFYPLLKLARLRVVRDSCTAYLHCRHHVQCCLLYEAPSLNRKLNFKFAADVSSAQWYFNKQSSRTPFHIANSNILNSTTTTTVAIVAWIITVRECNDVLLTLVHCTFLPPKKTKFNWKNSILLKIPTVQWLCGGRRRSTPTNKNIKFYSNIPIQENLQQPRPVNKSKYLLKEMASYNSGQSAHLKLFWFKERSPLLAVSYCLTRDFILFAPRWWVYNSVYIPQFPCLLCHSQTNDKCVLPIL